MLRLSSRVLCSQAAGGKSQLRWCSSDLPVLNQSTVCLTGRLRVGCFCLWAVSLFPVLHLLRPSGISIALNEQLDNDFTNDKLTLTTMNPVYAQDLVHRHDTPDNSGNAASTVSNKNIYPDFLGTSNAHLPSRVICDRLLVGTHLDRTIPSNLERLPQTNLSIPRSQTCSDPLHKAPTIVSRRGFDLNLPSFEEISRPVSASACLTSNSMPPPDEHQRDGPFDRTASMHQIIRSSSLGPLTPPLEVEHPSWMSAVGASLTDLSVQSEQTGASGPQERDNIQPSQPVLPPGHSSSSDGTDDVCSLNFGGTPWFLRALRTVSEGPNVHAMSASTKVISQVLPPNASDQRETKTYEMVCDHLQRTMPEPRYISITHALTVSSSQVVEDFPKSPPATPNFNGGDSYFGDQTVFTHAAQVPVHHEFRVPGLNLAAPPQRHIMIAEANLTILERFIPPTSSEETKDFFNADSCRSYLADRLPELSLDAGSLLLLYPTRTGAETFTRQYVGPILDPLLRELTILKGMNTNAAERLGRMKAISSMYEFGDMKKKTTDLCASLNARVAIQKSRTKFAVVHSDTARIVLDRATWMTWFVEQEQQRMKQDLVEYHRDGGKLPDREVNKSELTAGMLAREIADSFRKSNIPAGDAAIEVGVFVIRRHRQPARG